MFKRILAANDGSEGGKKATLAAINLARKFEAGLHCISVKEQPSHYAATGRLSVRSWKSRKRLTSSSPK
jgi:nucleotide-binding universal stress UspA family protein